MSKKITFKGLRKFNYIMAGLHALQGFLILILSTDFSRPVYSTYLSLDNTTNTLVSTKTELFNLSLAPLIAAFFFMSAFAHLFIATVYNKKYNKDLKEGVNKARWFEYAVSASTMMVAISLLVGVFDINSLAMIFGLTAVMNLMGLVMEVSNRGKEKPSWISYWVGCLAGIIPWGVIAYALWLGAANGSKAPTFVYWIFVSIFAFFNCFALNMVLQYKKVGKWSNYIYGERAYIILSLVAKSALAWQVFGGTMQP